MLTHEQAKALRDKFQNDTLELIREVEAAVLAKQAAQSEPVAANCDEVICPNCCNQFRAIPVNVQQLMLDAGFEPPFKVPPPDNTALLNNIRSVLRDASKGYEAMGWGSQRIDAAIEAIEKVLPDAEITAR